MTRDQQKLCFNASLTLKFRSNFLLIYYYQFNSRVKHTFNMFGRVSRDLVQEQQNLFTQMAIVPGPRHDVEEIERVEMPELYDPCLEQMMETELLKVKYLSYFDDSRAPNGPMKEKVIGDAL